MTFLPQPGWHEALLAAAFAVRVGPGGGLRTLKSAKGCWVMTRRLISFLSTLPDAPPGPGSLLVSRLMAFRSHRATKPLRDMGFPRPHTRPLPGSGVGTGNPGDRPEGTAGHPGGL